MPNDEKRKEELRNFLDAMVDDNQEQAQVHFHNYLEDRMKGIVNPHTEVEVSDGDDAGADAGEGEGDEGTED